MFPRPGSGLPPGFSIGELGVRSQVSELETTGLFAGAIDSRLGEKLAVSRPHRGGLSRG